MVELTPTAGYIFLVVNGIFLIGIGLLARYTQIADTEDYEVAGRRVRWPLVSGSLVVTMTWASTLLVASEAGYVFGWPVVWIYPISQVSVALMVPFFTRIRDSLPRGTTFPEYIRLRYGKRVHLLTTLIILSINYIILFYLLIGLGFGFSPLFGMDFMDAVLIGGAIMIVFTVLGGLWSSLMTDYFQYLVLWLVVGVVFVFAIDSVGGLGPVYDNLQEQGEASGYSLFTVDAFYAYFLVYLFGWLFSNVGDQMIWQRMYSIKETKNTGKAISLAFFTWCFLPAMAAIIGIIGLSSGVSPDAPSEIFAETMLAFAPDWLIIAFAFLIFNAIASTFGSMLVAFASIITTDIWDIYREPLSSSQKLLYNQYIVVVAGTSAIIISVFLAHSILDLSLFMGAFFVVYGVPVFISFLWPRVTERAIFTAMGYGFIIALLFAAPIHYGWLQSWTGIAIETWQLYAFMFTTEALLVAVITWIDSEPAMTIENVGTEARKQGEAATMTSLEDD